MSIEEWDAIKDKIDYDFQKDNHFTELKDAEVLQNRINIMRDMDEFVGKYYSNEWVRKNVLYQSDNDIEEIDGQIQDEGEENSDEDEFQDDQE